MLELLNSANANAYYANQCRWMRRPYAAWQNHNSSRERRALDRSGKELDPFRSHMHVDVDEVGALLMPLLERAVDQASA